MSENLLNHSFSEVCFTAFVFYSYELTYIQLVVPFNSLKR
jgi:hypothetical protein